MTVSSGTVFAGSEGSIRVDAVTSASASSGETATLWGGLAQLPGAFTSPTSLGGDAPRSMTLTVSGGAFRTTVLTPSTFSTLLSLEETASCAAAGPRKKPLAESIAVVGARNRQAGIALTLLPVARANVPRAVQIAYDGRWRRDAKVEHGGLP